MYFLRKLLQTGISPLSGGLLCLALVAIFAVRRPRFARGVALLGLILLVVASTPLFADVALGRLEKFVPPRPLADEPRASVAVVLGGTVAIYTDESHPAEELGGSRIATTAKLYHLGKVAKVLVSSGIAYTRSDGSKRTEADDMRDLLIDAGVPSDSIIVEDRAQNTKENAHYSAKLLATAGVSEILLVTSAYHLKRATELFRAAGLTVHPVAAGRFIRTTRTEVGDIIPNAHALSRTTTALKEFLGSAFDSPLPRETLPQQVHGN